MEYRIVEKDAFVFAGVSKRVPMQFEGVNNAIVELAQSLTPAQMGELHRLQDTEPKTVVNISWNSDTDFKEESGHLTHMIGVLTTQEDISEDLEALPQKAGTWAVFPSEGSFPQAMQQTMADIYAKWLPESDFELSGSLTFSFTRMSAEADGTAYCECWIPVKKADGED